MATVALPAPKNTLVSIVNIVLDSLIMGLGETAAIAAAVGAAPWLGLPVINWIFSQLVHALASTLDSNLKKSVDIILIRFQNDLRKAEYDKAIEDFKKAPLDPGALAAARNAIDNIVRRNH